MSASNITSNSADLSWLVGGTETSWNIEYGLVGFNLGSGNLTQAATNPFLLSGLVSNTSYDYYIQADCGNNTPSRWVGPYSFTTSCSDPTGFNGRWVRCGLDNVTVSGQM